MTRLLLALLLAAPALAIPPRCATILVHVQADLVTVDGRHGGSDRFSALRHLGWMRAVRPPGVCVRTALARYRERYGDRGPVPLPQNRDELAERWQWYLDWVAAWNKRLQEPSSR